MKPDLLVMAAGMGSRYGGLKQIDSVGPNGETIIDYSIYDAINAGFGRVVFIIRKEIEDVFKDAVGSKYNGRIDVDYVFQELDVLPSGYSVPADRAKPWGTGHAILVAAEVTDKPFAVINADDFYGAESFEALARFLNSSPNADEYCMVGFKLANTLSKHGTVARGICSTNEDGILQTVTETYNISPPPISSDAGPLTGEEIASMNMWGFKPSIFGHLNEQFADFMNANADNPKAEFFIPEVVGELIESKKASVKVLETASTWLGVTYKEDKASVISEMQILVDDSIYPSPLW